MAFGDHPYGEVPYGSHGVTLLAALIIAPSGIVSTEDFGSLLVNSPQIVTFNAIASAEAFGSQKVNKAVQPPAIATAEAFGTSLLNRLILFSGLASEEAFGSPIVDQEDVETIIPASIASAEAFGGLIVNVAAIPISPNGITSEEAHGTPFIYRTVSLPSINSGEAVGTPQANLRLLFPSIGSLEAFGTLAVRKMRQFVIPTAINSLEAIGSLSVQQANFITPSGISSGENFGELIVVLTPALVGPPTLLAYQIFVLGPAGNLTRVEELENARVTEIVWELNGAGTANVTMPTADTKLRSIRTGHNEIQIWRKGTLLWWGLPWRRRGDSKNTFFECEGIESYFYKRHIEHTKLFVNVDQINIVWNLINYAQNIFGSLGITSASFLPSGKTRIRTYNKDEYHLLGNILRNFSEYIDGFDWSIETYGDGRREFTPYYPRRGIIQNNLTCEWGRNVIDYSDAEDAQRLANHVVITGEGEGPSKSVGVATEWGLDFDGVDDRVVASNFTPAGSTWTLETDVYFPSFPGATRTFLYKGSTSVEDFGFRIRTDGKLEAFVFSTGGTEGLAVGNTILKTKRFYHVAFSYDGSTLRLFINGIEDVFASLSASVRDSGNVIRLGQGITNYVAMRSREVRIWTVARSQVSISADRNRFLTGKEANLVLYWNFQEGITSLQNIVINGDGETGGDTTELATGWAKLNGNALMPATDNVYAGTYALKIDNPTAEDSYSYQDMQVFDGAYILQGRVRTTALPAADPGYGAVINLDTLSEDITFSIVSKIGDNPNAAEPDIGIQADGVSHSFEFVECRFNVTGSGMVRLYLQLGYGPGVQSGTAWFDEVQLYRDNTILNDVTPNPYNGTITGAAWILGSDYVWMSEVQTESTTADLGVLTEKAQSLLSARKEAIVLPEIQINNEIEFIGILREGDLVPVRIDHGATYILGTYRIARIRLDPPTDTARLEFVNQ